jgi:DNA mismatch endonuclease (patch repair protein)
MTDTVSREKRSEIMRAVKSVATTPERLVKQALAEKGIILDPSLTILPGKPDVVISKRRTAIFVHGCFWHGHSCGRCRIPKTHRGYWVQKIRRNVARDRRMIRSLRRMGWHVYTVWECQLHRAIIATTIDRLCGRLRNRKKICRRFTCRA